jgi:hypothetical protein
LRIPLKEELEGERSPKRQGKHRANLRISLLSAKFVDKYILPKFSHKKGNFDIVYKFGGSDISIITSPRDEQTYHLHKRVNT